MVSTSSTGRTGDKIQKTFSTGHAAASPPVALEAAPLGVPHPKAGLLREQDSRIGQASSPWRSGGTQLRNNAHILHHSLIFVI